MTLDYYKIFAIKPKAAINIPLNPSFETGTTGWTAGGTNTITQSSEQSRRGVFSAKCTYVDNGTLANYAITLTSAAHVASLDIYIPDGVTFLGGLKLRFINFIGSTTVDATINESLTGRWQRVECKISPDAGDLVGNVVLVCTSASGAIYIDGLQVELGTVATTYFDGDSKGTLRKVQEYYWTGARHASRSVRTANTRSGGELIDLADYCHKIGVEGLGQAPMIDVSVGLTSGAERYLYSSPSSRYFTLNVVFEGKSVGEVVTNRNNFKNLVKHNATPYAQPLVLQYQGYNSAGVPTSDPININCVYVSGLDRAPHQNRPEIAEVTFKMHDTSLYLDGDQGVELGFQTEMTGVKGIVYRDADGVWHEMNSGIDGDWIQEIKTSPITGIVYICGLFAGADGVANTANICAWDGENFTALGTGVNGQVRDIAFDANGDLYAIGTFTNAGGGAANRIAKYTVSTNTWSALGTGLNALGDAVAIDRNGDLYAGGSFTTAGGVAANYVAKYTVSTSTWSALGSGLDDACYKIVITYDTIYFGGDQTTANGSTSRRISKYDISGPVGTHAWYTGFGLTSVIAATFGTIDAIIIDKSNNIYIGGDAGSSPYLIYRFNGSKWEGVVIGSGIITGMAFDENSNQIYFSGSLFSALNGINFPDDVCVLSNDVVFPVDIDLGATVAVYEVYFSNNNILYVSTGNGITATSATVTIPNVNGDEAYPIIEATGPGTLWQIKNYTNNRAIYFNGLTLLAGETLTLDLRPNKGTMLSSFRGSVKNYLVKGSNLDFPIVPGNNNISGFMTGTTAASKLTMRWTPRYLSLDSVDYD